MTPQALQVLSSLEHVPASLKHGPGVRITQENLSRELYLEVAQVLEQCGAKWNRSRKLHLHGPFWDQGMLEDVIATGEAPPKNPLSFFPSPVKIADEIAKWCECVFMGVYIEGERYASRILEPSAGTGSLVDAFLRHIETLEIDEPCVEIVMIEMDVRRARILERKYKNLPEGIEVKVVCEDFLSFAANEAKEGGKFDAILANPPFSMPNDRTAWRTHLQAMIPLLDKRGRMAIVVPDNVVGSAYKRTNLTTVSDLETIEFLGACQVDRWPKGTFESTAIATATLYVDAENLFDRSWDGESVWVENTHELMDVVEKCHKKHGLAQMTPAVRACAIQVLTVAALEGQEHVLFDDDSLEKFRVKMHAYFSQG